MASSWPQLRDEAIEIVTGADEIGVTLRVVGSAGIRLHCAPPDAQMERLGRRAKDIDFVVLKEDRKKMRRFLEARGYVADRDLLVAMEGARYSFAQPQTQIELDVFVEKLQFNHTIEVRDRLRQHRTTLPLEELLLAKLQIVSPTTTDLLDVSVLLATHPVVPAPSSDEEIDADRIASLLARDWGFHHTVVANLTRIRQSLGEVVDLGAELHDTVRQRVDALAQAVQDKPKTMGWRVRARVGERVQWWEDVNEREEAY